MHPFNAGASDTRRIIEQIVRRFSGCETNQNTAQLINAVNGGGGIVDCGRDRPQGDIDNLQNTELDVLLQSSGGTDVDGGQKLSGSFGRKAISLRHNHQRNSHRNEVTDAAQNANARPMVFGSGDYPLRVDETDVARACAQDGNIILAGTERFISSWTVPMMRQGHQLIDDALRFFRN